MMPMTETLKKVIAIYANFTGYDWMSAVMDIESVDKDFSMDWKAFLNADAAERTHDIVGIATHLDRETYPATMGDCFVPRFHNPALVKG